MEHTTITTLGQLRKGDSFLFMKGDRKTVRRVTVPVNQKNMVAINIPIPGGWFNRYDDMKRARTEVMFLRHTIPLPGEECFMEDLKPGDVFFRPEDIIHEYVVQETGSDFWTVRKMCEAAPIKAGRLSKVIFVRHD